MASGSTEIPAPTENPSSAMPTSAAPPTSFAPAGAGQTFAPVAPTANKVKKKRNRTARIGAAAQQQPPPQLPDPASQSTSTKPSQVQESDPSPPTPLRNEAQEATKRAEDFLTKMEQQQPTASKPPKPTESAKKPSKEEEDILAKAKAAAQKAQQFNKAPARSGGFLGGFFRSSSGSTRSPSPPVEAKQAAATVKISAATSGDPPRKSADAAEEKPAVKDEEPTPTTDEAPPQEQDDVAASGEESAAERLLREQMEVQRIMEEKKKERLAMLEKEENNDSGYAPVELPSPPKSSGTGAFGSIPVPKPASGPSSFSFMAPSSSYTPSSLASQDKSETKQEPTARDEFNKIMRDFRSKVVQSMEEMKRLRQHKTGLLEERFQAAAKERLCVSKKEQAEAQQMAAVESEDFELADRMNTVMEQVESERLEYSRIAENIGRALQQLQEQQQSLVSQVTGYFTDIQQSLQSFLEKQDAFDSEGAVEKLKKFSEISQQIATEEERLQQDLKHLERDANLVKAERQEVEDAISEQAGQFEKKRDEARVRVKEVENEMEELRQLLAAKQKEVAQLRTEAAGHDEAVLKVRIKFSRQLGRVQTKEMTIEDNRQEWEMEQRTVQEQKKAHDDQVEQHQNAMLERDALMDLLNTEVEMADTFQAIVGKEVGFDGGDDAAKGGQGTSDESLLQQGRLVECEAAVTEAREVLHAAEHSVSTLQNEKSTLEAKLPELEELKKSSAAKRDYRTAGKASKEIKESQSRLDDLDAEINQAKERQENALQVVQDREEALASEQKLAAEREREGGLKKMKELADHMSRLKATQESVFGDCSEDSIQGVGAFVLSAQLEALRLEGQTYGEKFGGWEEILNEAGVLPATDTPPSLPSKDETTTTEESPGSAPQVDGGARKAAMKEFRALTAQIEDMNGAIDATAANEDYEKAAELEEAMQSILAKADSLGLTDDEMAMALAMTEDVDEGVAADESAAGTSGEVGTAEAPTEDVVATEEPAVAETQENSVEDTTNEATPSEDQTDAPVSSEETAPTLANDTAPENDEPDDTIDEKKEAGDGEDNGKILEEESTGIQDAAEDNNTSED